MSREQFETFAADYESNFTRNEDDAGDEYANCTLQVMWETWQACELSLKQQRDELQSRVDFLNDQNSAQQEQHDRLAALNAELLAALQTARQKAFCMYSKHEVVSFLDEAIAKAGGVI